MPLRLAVASPPKYIYIYIYTANWDCIPIRQFPPENVASIRSPTAHFCSTAAHGPSQRSRQLLRVTIILRCSPPTHWNIRKSMGIFGLFALYGPSRRLPYFYDMGARGTWSYECKKTQSYYVRRLNRCI
ncbi:hypothetical protein I7I48_04301 [Histoplasma ohiense]|nr:hypothetical protein I7I48_04301 [Histoplasma ohiense (nom. inval.)]